MGTALGPNSIFSLGDSKNDAQICYKPSSSPDVTLYKIILSTKAVPELARIPELSRKINRPAISTSFRELRETSSNALFTPISELMQSTQAHWSTMSFSVEHSSSGVSGGQQAGQSQSRLQRPRRRDLRVRTQDGLLSAGPLTQSGRRSASPSSSIHSASSVLSSVLSTMTTPLLGPRRQAPVGEQVPFPSSSTESLD